MRYHEGWHHAGYPVLGWLVPLVMLAGFAVLLVWVVRRSGPPALPPAVPPAAPPSPRADTALETVRARYARGEIDRDEYLRLTADLGGSAPPGP